MVKGVSWEATWRHSEEGKVEEKDNAEDAESAESAELRGSGNVDCDGGAEKFGFAVQMKKPRYHAGFVRSDVATWGKVEEKDDAENAESAESAELRGSGNVD